MTRARDVANLQSGAIINEAGADLDFRIESDDNANMFFIDGGNDKVGIGTNSPNFDIHVHQSDSTNSIIQFTNSTTGTTSNDGLLVGINSSEQAQVFNRENTDLLFATNNTERTRIGSSGEIQIGGTTNAGFIDFDGSNLQFNTQRNPNTGTFVNTGKAHTSITMFDGNGTAANSYIRFMTTNANNTGATERMRIDSSGDILIGDGQTSIHSGGVGANNTFLQVHGSSGNAGVVNLGRDTTTDNQSLGELRFYNSNNADDNNNDADGVLVGVVQARSETSDSNAGDDSGGHLIFSTKPEAGSLDERMRIDSAGDFLFGKTAQAFETAGVAFRGAPTSGQSGFLFTRDGNNVIALNRLTDNGNLIQLAQDGSLVGIIGVNTSDYPFIANPASGGAGIAMGAGTAVIPTDNTGQHSDNTKDVGASSVRFDDVFATNGTIQTSDKNEKQDIASMTTAELAVGKRLSTLFKTFRWKSKVTEKADKARTHSGIIAQEVKAAFEAEGLDATKYALFCSDTWWEKEISVDAVEADEEKGIEAKDAYTYIDNKYVETEGYSEKTRLGVRYPELLSFIASYNESRFTAIEARLTALEK